MLFFSASGWLEHSELFPDAKELEYSKVREELAGRTSARCLVRYGHLSLHTKKRLLFSSGVPDHHHLTRHVWEAPLRPVQRG